MMIKAIQGTEFLQPFAGESTSARAAHAGDPVWESESELIHGVCRLHGLKVHARL